MRWIWDWAKYHNSHSSKSIRVTKLSFGQSGFPRSTPFWQKNQFAHSWTTEQWFMAHSYTFWTMAILIFRPVSNSSHHPLNTKNLLISQFLFNYNIKALLLSRINSKLENYLTSKIVIIFVSDLHTANKSEVHLTKTFTSLQN